MLTGAMRTWQKLALFLLLSAAAAACAILFLSVREAHINEEGKRAVVARCLEGYAVAAYLHGGVWSFAQVFERDSKGTLVPVRCGKGPFGGTHWRTR